MKNNHYDFIKDKFNKTELEVPLCLETELIEQKILSNERHKTIKFDTKHNRSKEFVVIAACLVLILSIVFATNPNFFNYNKVATFDNYGDLNSKISTLETVSTDDGMGSGIFITKIYNIEDGVEIPYTVKAYDGYIYYAYYNSNDSNNRNKVYIYKAENEKTNLVSIIDDFNLDEYEIQDLFVKNNRLIINLSSSTKTQTKVYDITDQSNPSLISEFEQCGSYSESYFINGTFYIVTNYGIDENSTENSIPNIKYNNTTIFASSKNIAYFEDTKTAQYAVINAIDIESAGAAENLIAVLGGSAKVYCTSEFMYINEYKIGEDCGEPEKDVASAMKLNLKNAKLSYASDDEVKAYSNNTIDIGKGESYNGVIYPVGENYLCIGEEMNEAQNEIFLYDKNMNELDSLIIKDAYITTNIGSLAVNETRKAFAVPAYFADKTRRYYGVMTFEIQNNEIVVTNEFKNNDNDLMYQGLCVFIGDYIYSFDVNDNSPDNEKLRVFAHKY